MKNTQPGDLKSKVSIFAGALAAIECASYAFAAYYELRNLSIFKMIVELLFAVAALLLAVSLCLFPRKNSRIGLEQPILSLRFEKYQNLGTRDYEMGKKEKLIRLLPGFFFLITVSGFIVALIFSFVPTLFLYLIVPFSASCAFRNYCRRKYSYNPKWERIFRVTILVSGILGVIAIIVYLILTSLM